MSTPRPTIDQACTLIQRWYQQALQAVEPEAAVRRSLTWDGGRLSVDDHLFQVAPRARLVAIAVGKAAAPMARGVTTVLGDRIDAGILLTRDGHATNPPDGWQAFEASHPVPDERGVGATRVILDAVRRLEPGDIALVLVSGGGSALLESPRPPLSLIDIQEVTRLMLRAGAPIQHLNAVRSELSEVKGGGLRRAIGEATCVSLILSDVLGNDPRIIASGPTITRAADPEGALKLLASYGLLESVPEAVVSHLESPHADAAPAASPNDAYVVIGDNDLFIDEVAAQATADGLRSIVARRGVEGEAAQLGRDFVNLAEGMTGADVVIQGGEATVTVRGHGTGGRNTEFALSAALALHERPRDFVVGSLASDGQDGSVDAAGAIIDPGTVSRNARQGLDALASLLNNDSGGYFAASGELVRPGPTGTNVNDVAIAIRTASNGRKDEQP